MSNKLRLFGIVFLVTVLISGCWFKHSDIDMVAPPPPIRYVKMFEDGSLYVLDDALELVLVQPNGSILSRKAVGFVQMFMLDKNTGWGIEKNGTIRKTVDGESWIKASEFFANSGGISCFSCRFFFFDSEHGVFSLTEGKLFLTIDGGRHWKPIFPPDEPIQEAQQLEMKRFSMVSESKLFVFTVDGRIFKTENGGRDWKAVGERNGIDPNAAYTDGTTRFLVEGRGGGGVYYSEDSGQEWKEVLADENLKKIFVNSFWFNDDQVGWLGGHFYDQNNSESQITPALFKTIDSGRSWKRMEWTEPSAGSISRIEFVDTKRGFVSTSEQIFVTLDGAKSWKRIYSDRKAKE